MNNEIPSIFQNCTIAAGDVSGWDISGVTNMQLMFSFSFSQYDEYTTDVLGNCVKN